MNKRIILLLSSFTYAAHMYQEPNQTSEVVSNIDSDHTYTIQTQDWVEVMDENTKEHGWAKLSELKSSLSSNSQWTYRWQSDSNGEKQTMHYKPFNEEDITRHVKRVHNQHKKIMAEFQSFWDEFEKTSESISKDAMSFVGEE